MYRTCWKSGRYAVFRQLRIQQKAIFLLTNQFTFKSLTALRKDKFWDYGQCRCF